ncbi:translation initiation factor IF3-1, mitochondrial [Cornus florida]|uniref:translation initiation factor IF3-1, mitochondrial n=1 Tax=Cornus florida TaxID=4283 RepID=UPI00289E969A|nr:translation initiation factor IF3-1, mitochondrial [Cornus florida]
MAFWCRIKQSNLKSLSNQFKRRYSQIPGPCSVNHAAGHTRIRVLDKPCLIIHNNPFVPRNNVRFFAAPVQFTSRRKEDSSGPRLNEKITAEVVRLVTDEGHFIVSRREALERAKRLELDLVEVQRTAKPPVCKLMDYHKERYKQKQIVKEKVRAKSKSEVTLRTGVFKEIRFTEKIEQKDLQMKADMAKRMMERGYRVKCTAMGTNMGTPKDEKEAAAQREALAVLLSRISTLIEDFSIVDTGPQVEKKQAYLIARHVKFGPSKKGSGKKASKDRATSDVVQESNESPLQFEENSDTADSSLESEDDSDFEQLETEYEEVPASPFVASQATENRYKSGPSNRSPPRTPMDFRGPGLQEAPLSPKFDSTTTDEVPSSPFVARQGTENRYKSGPSNRSPPRTPMDFRGPGVQEAPISPKFDSTTTDEVPSSPFVARQGTENRYKSGPSSRSPPRTPMDFRGPSLQEAPISPKFDSTTTDEVPAPSFVAGQVMENRYKSGPSNRSPPRTPMDFRGPGVQEAPISPKFNSTTTHEVPSSPFVAQQPTENRYKSGPSNRSLPRTPMDFRGPSVQEAPISPKFNSTTHEVPSSPFVARQPTENRYKSGPSNGSPPRTPMDFRGPGVRDSVRSEPQLSNQPRQPKFDLNFPSPTREPMDFRGLRDSVRSEPELSNQQRQPKFGLNFPPPTREAKRVETDASLFSNLKSPAEEIPKQEALHPSAPSSPKSYGIFSSPKASDK